MSSTVDHYLRTVDRLRESRRSNRWSPEQDRPLLALLEDLYEALADAEKEIVEAAGWRGWPEQFDARMGSVAPLQDVPLRTLLGRFDTVTWDRLPCGLAASEEAHR
jgi:hypothetical protein